jgi:hypothetical protein
MKNMRVLIVGAGAGGLVTGYHLALSGAEVTFYVRPGRLQELQPPQSLYCYDDCQLKVFDGYQLISELAAVEATLWDFVVVTLDGHTAFTAEGSALLKALGKAVINSPAVIVNLGVGFELKAHYVAMTGLPEHRILSGTFNLLSHFVENACLPIHGAVGSLQLQQARIAYRHINGSDGLVIDNVSIHQAKGFARLYGACGVSGCKLVSPLVVDMMFNLLFPLFAVFELGGWGGTEATVKNKALWQLGCGAVKDIAGLPRFGWQGKLIKWFVGPRLLRKLWFTLDSNSLPLDFHGFNKLHHGGKVVAQDTEIMRANLVQGQQLGLRMPNLQKLLERLDSQRTRS